MSRFNSMIPVSLVIALLLFFLAELKLFGLDEHLRATNQVLILFALLILPFVLISMPAFVQSLTLKVSDKEFHVQLSELETGEASVFVSYESDPQIINEEVKKLADPEGFFPRYMALALVSQAALDKVHGLEEVLNKLQNIMTTDELNAVVVGLSNASYHPLFAKSEAEKLLQKLGN